VSEFGIHKNSDPPVVSAAESAIIPDRRGNGECGEVGDGRQALTREEVRLREHDKILVGKKPSQALVIHVALQLASCGPADVPERDA
jgi:hypothetical protein